MNVNRIGIASTLIVLAAFLTTFSCEAQAALYSIKPVDGIRKGACLAVNTSNRAEFQTCNVSSTRQSWERIAVGGNEFAYKNQATQLCIELAAGRLGAKFIPVACTYAARQRFLDTSGSDKLFCTWYTTPQFCMDNAALVRNWSEIVENFGPHLYSLVPR